MTARIVIIGGGQAGGWAAKTLRDEGFSGEICVVAEEQWDFYERPPLSKAALLEAEPALPRLFSAEVQQALLSDASSQRQTPGSGPHASPATGYRHAGRESVARQ